MKGEVYYNDLFVGIIEKRSDGFYFTYDENYLANSSLPAISLTLPKQQKPHTSKILFPFFYGLLAEGDEKEMQCKQLKIDEIDHFQRLLKTASNDTIGAVTVRAA